MVALRHLTKIQCRESTSITLPRRKDMLFTSADQSTMERESVNITLQHQQNFIAILSDGLIYHER